MITEMLKLHREKEKASFHMPGHKNGVGFLGTPFSDNPFQFDTTELPGTDALIEPSGAILEAEKKAALLYDAKHSFFLVNGSTGGILSMVYSAFKPGDTVIVDRNCHQSVLNGMTLAGVKPIYVTPEESEISGVPGTVSANSIQKVLETNTAVKGAIITSPNYYGAVADIQKIADLLHQKGAVLLVDEAHGAHFPFSSLLPPSAVSLGADMSVVSLHKTLPAPNQTALLHIGKNISVDAARAAVRMLQTSSPSYVLLAAMEYSLRYAQEKGETETKRLLDLLAPLQRPTLDDPLKLMPSWAHKGISGYMAEKILREQFGIYVEMCDSLRVLCMTSWCNSAQEISLLKEAFAYLDSLPDQGKPIEVPSQNQPAIVAPALAPFEVKQRPCKTLSIEDAEGTFCAQAVSAFPPCIPILLPGEIITGEKILQLQRLQQSGATITGMNLDRVMVIA